MFWYYKATVDEIKNISHTLLVKSIHSIQTHHYWPWSNLYLFQSLFIQHVLLTMTSISLFKNRSNDAGANETNHIEDATRHGR